MEYENTSNYNPSKYSENPCFTNTVEKLYSTDRKYLKSHPLRKMSVATSTDSKI